MPSSWSSRFLPTSNSSSSGSTPSHRHNARSGANPKDKPLPPPPRPPSATFDPPPALGGRDGERAIPSPVRPQTSGGRQHSHHRSSSHPLPRLFGRKKSAGNIRDGYHDTDVPLDDELVPVLPDQAAPTAPGPTRATSGKRTIGAPTARAAIDEEDKATRRCMCCDSRVNVPRALDKFRCMCCLTINDLRPVEEQQEEERQRIFAARSGIASVSGVQKEGFPGGLPPDKRVVPLTVERTRAVIDRCVIGYLEGRCSRGDNAESPEKTMGEKEQSSQGLAIRPSQRDLPLRQQRDQGLSTSPFGMSQPGERKLSASAAIKDFSDFDQFAYSRTDTPALDPRPSPSALGSASDPRKDVPAQPSRQPPPPPIATSNRAPSQKLHPGSGGAPNGEQFSRPQVSPRQSAQEVEQRRRYDRVKAIFRPLEDYIIQGFGDFKALNTSFSTTRPTPTGRAQSESNIVTPPPEPVGDHHPSPVDLSQLDAKTLLLGDIGENSMWWTGKSNRKDQETGIRRKKVGESSRRPINSKSANINWAELANWYELVHSAGEDWQGQLARVKSSLEDGSSTEKLEGSTNFESIEEDLAEAREHATRALLKVTENVLKRPGRALKEPEQMRFLLIILANPSLYPSLAKRRAPARRSCNTFGPGQPPSPQSPRKSPGRDGSQHTGILKRVFGLLAHSPDNCHRYIIGWFSRFDEVHFTRIVDLIASFVTHRLVRKSNRPRSKSTATTGGLIPDLSGSAMNVSAQLQSAMGLGGSVKNGANEPDQEPDYVNDWQIRAAARSMSLLFAANNIWQGRRKAQNGETDMLATSSSPPVQAKRSGQLLHTSSFYNTLLDYGDILSDFRLWESKRDRFAFCQYPLFLSMGNKIKILEFDARRQMEIKAREAYFDSVIRQRALDGHFHLRVRRDCMVDDSLRQISEAVGSGQEELKKGLRVHFAGEEGVDAGGPRKEWFLMLVRDIFDPNHGMFIYDEEANTCYFNPNSFETSDQYHLVGALLGLAIYNSTILDVALPPFAFRKLLAAAPAAVTGSASVSSVTGTKGQMTYTLSDLAEFRPSLAAGLQQLLDYEGDVENTYCWSFVAPVERYGTVIEVPLISNGEATPVTSANRHEFVEAYVRYLLDTAVTRQFEPFKRGFFHVCAGNALSLFRAEEIELLIRGSDEALDVDSLRAVAVYENWRAIVAPHQLISNPADDVDVLRWFWDIFARAPPAFQRKLLTFLTGSDRIPAVGATSLVLRIVCGGDGGAAAAGEGADRFPVARTCFNMLVLWRYPTREVLEEKIWRAVGESEGFGLK